MDQHPALDAALVCTPEKGHALPTVHVARALAARGHRVRVCVCDWAAEDFRKLVEDAGGEVVPLRCTGGMTKERHAEVLRFEGTNPFSALMGPMHAPLVDAFQARRPDVVVADFGALAAMNVAEELAIPLVVNVPGPVSLANDALGLMDSSTHRSFLGLHIGLSSRGSFGFFCWLNVKGMGDWFGVVRRHAGRGAMLLFNSFWGLDSPQALPPNMVLTGPLLPPPVALRAALQEKDPGLCHFLETSGSAGVVFVTTGTVVDLTAWQVEALFAGLKRVGCKVVWSLKSPQQAFLPRRDDPDFYVSSWVPQAELLQHEAVKVVITHCGWGGTLEIISATKPVVAMPFFGDQPTNAELLVKAGMGEPVGRIPRALGKDHNPYRKGDVTAESVRAAVSGVLADYGRYKAAVQRLAEAAQAMGGPDEAVKQIEWAARIGTAHRLMPNLPQTMGSFVRSGLATVAGWAALGGAAVVAVALVKRHR